MDLSELQKHVDKISKQVKKETESQPALAVLINTQIAFFQILFTLLREQNEIIKKQSDTIREQSDVIKSLSEKLGNKVLDSKRANSENINGRGSEMKKGVDSSEKNPVKTSKNAPKTNSLKG